MQQRGAARAHLEQISVAAHRADVTAEARRGLHDPHSRRLQRLHLHQQTNSGGGSNPARSILDKVRSTQPANSSTEDHHVAAHREWCGCHVSLLTRAVDATLWEGPRPRGAALRLVRGTQRSKGRAASARNPAIFRPRVPQRSMAAPPEWKCVHPLLSLGLVTPRGIPRPLDRIV